MPELLELLDDQDHFFPQLGSQERHADEFRVLVAVADDQAAGLVLQGEPGEQLGLAADFEPEMERLAGIEYLLHHLAELVDFDRKNALVLALVIVFLDGRAEGQVDRLHPVAQDVLKPDQEREFQAPRPGLLRDVADLDLRARFLKRTRHDVSFLVDVKVARAPTRDVVKVARGLDVPWGRRNFTHSHFSNERTIGRRVRIATDD